MTGSQQLQASKDIDLKEPIEATSRNIDEINKPQAKEGENEEFVFSKKKHTNNSNNIISVLGSCVIAYVIYTVFTNFQIIFN